MSLGARSSSRERTRTEKGQGYQLDLDRGEGLRLYKEWNKLLERAKDILLRSNDLSLLTNVKEALLSVEVEVNMFTQSHEVELGSQVAEIPSEHADVITFVENRISALQAASVISSINKSVHSDRPRESAILEEAQLSEVDSKFLVVETNLEEEQKKIENKLRQLKLDKLIERGKVISHVRRESLLNPDVDPFPPNLPEPGRHQLPVDHISGDPSMSTRNQYVSSHNSPIVQQVLLSRMPMPTPVPFEGDCLQFPAWKNSFDTLIVQSGMPPSERLYYLAKCLKGEPYDCIQGFFILSSETAYYEAMNQLVHRYGNKYVIASAFRSKLYEWPKIGASDSMGLRKLSDFANQCLSAKRIYDSLNILDDETEHLKVVAKLPESLVARWARKVHEFKNRGLTFSLFASFVEFLFVESELACDPIISVGAVKALSNKCQSGVHDSYLRGAKATVHSTQSGGVWCIHCKLEGHSLVECDKFAHSSYVERFSVIKSVGLCFGCLKSGHSSRFCKNRLQCSTCGGRHPTLLHDPDKSQQIKKDMPVTKSSNYQSPDQDLLQEMATQTEAQCFHVDSDKGDKCSMIIPVYVSHVSCPEKEVLVYCLLDNQSDTSFILSSVTKSLGVQGHEVDLSLSTMSGQGQVVNSSVMNGLVVRGYDKVGTENRVNLTRAYTTDVMPANRSHIPTKRKVRSIPNLEWLDSILSDELDIPIGLLIGYNCAQALIPKGVVSSQREGLFAQQSVLGWGLIGFVDSSYGNDDVLSSSHDLLPGQVESFHISQVEDHSSVCFRTNVAEVFSTVGFDQSLDFTKTMANSPIPVHSTSTISKVSNIDTTVPFSDSLVVTDFDIRSDAEEKHPGYCQVVESKNCEIIQQDSHLRLSDAEYNIWRKSWSLRSATITCFIVTTVLVSLLVCLILSKELLSENVHYVRWSYSAETYNQSGSQHHLSILASIGLNGNNINGISLDLNHGINKSNRCRYIRLTVGRLDLTNENENHTSWYSMLDVRFLLDVKVWESVSGTTEVVTDCLDLVIDDRHFNRSRLSKIYMFEVIQTSCKGRYVTLIQIFSYNKEGYRSGWYVRQYITEQVWYR